MSVAGDLVLRAAGANDLPALLALYQQLHPQDAPMDVPHARATFESILGNPLLELMVAEAEGVVVATCYLNVIPNLSRGLAPYAVLENVVTEQRLRGQGIGKAMVAHALARAWQRGCYKVMLQTGSQRESTHQFYRACGFSSSEKFAFVARHPAPSPPR